MELKKISSDELKAASGKYRVVTRVGGVLCQVGEDVSNVADALDLCRQVPKEQPLFVYDEEGLAILES